MSECSISVGNRSRKGDGRGGRRAHLVDSRAVALHVVRSTERPRAAHSGAVERLEPLRRMRVHVRLRKKEKKRDTGRSASTFNAKKRKVVVRISTLRLKARANGLWQMSQTCLFFSGSPSASCEVTDDDDETAASLSRGAAAERWNSCSDPSWPNDDSPTLLNAYGDAPELALQKERGHGNGRSAT